MVGVSRRHLERVFLANHGCSPQAWLNEQRLLLARAMLPSAETVKGVALELGFAQPSHFSRQFAKRFGVPPTQYMRARKDATERVRVIVEASLPNSGIGLALPRGRQEIRKVAGG